MKQNAEDNLFVETEDSLGAEPEASNDGMSVTNDAPSPAPTKSHKKVALPFPFDFKMYNINRYYILKLTNSFTTVDST